MKKIIFLGFILIIFATVAKSQIRIKMQKEGGVFMTPCTINGLKLRFIFDTGASNVSISLSEASFMIKNGYLLENDLQGLSYSQLANGAIIENTTVNLREVEIGGIKIYNVEAKIIHDLNAPLLLGQSAIQKLGKIQIEGNELIIMNSDAKSIQNKCIEAKELLQIARKYFDDKLDDLAAEAYIKVNDLCPAKLDCNSLSIAGTACFMSGKYASAISFLTMAVDCEANEKMQYFNYNYLSKSYIYSGNFDNVLFFIMKGLNYAKEKNEISDCYFDLAFTYTYHFKDYQKAIDYYEKSIDLYLTYISVEEDDILSGKVKNQALAARYSNLSIAYEYLGQKTNAEKCDIKALLLE